MAGWRRIDVRFERPELSAYPAAGSSVIYALCCPDTEEPRYIGKARDAIRRYHQHIAKPRIRLQPTYRDNWISSLRASDKRPILYIVDNVPDAEWEQAEQFYVTEFRRLGARLTNGNGGGSGGAAGVRRLRGGRRLSEEQRMAIRRRLSDSQSSEHYVIKRTLASNYHFLAKRDADAAARVAVRMRELYRMAPDLWPAKWATIGLDVAA